MSTLLNIWFTILNLNIITAAVQKPNIIIIIADDLGHYDVGFLGSNQIPTPNIDALAYNGVILNRFYTYSTCTPSRAALLTGSYPTRSGMEGYPITAGENRALPLNMTIMPEYLKKLGYKTHLVGKWHLGHAKRDHTPTRRGFDTHFGYWTGTIGYFDYVARSHFPPGTVSTHRRPRLRFSQDFAGLDVWDQLEPSWGSQGKYATELFTRKSLEVIDNHNTEVPLFLVLAHLAPHCGSDGLVEVPNVTKAESKYSYIRNQGRRRYADAVDHLDKSVGQLMTKLSDRNMLENSIVLFFSDNGGIPVGYLPNYGSNWPLRGVKFSNFEGAIRTAAAIYSPLLKKRSYVNNELIHITDLLPTIYKAIGASSQDLGTTDGINQWEVISEGLHTNRSEILVDINSKDNISSIIGDGRYKLVQGSGILFDGTKDQHYGEKDEGVEYNVKDVLGSSTNLAIHNNLSESKIFELRNQTDLTRGCRLDTEETINCTQNGCLFDIKSDPCETTNIYESHRNVTLKLERRLEEFWLERVLHGWYFTNPASNPIFYNNTWCTWLDDEWCIKTKNVT